MLECWARLLIASASPRSTSTAGMDAARELPQLVDRKLQLLLGLLQERARQRRLGSHDPGRVAQPQRQPGQAQLSPVMQVVLEPAPRVVGSRDHARPGSDEPRGEALSLADDRGQAERRERCDGDEELRVEHAARDRLEVERAVVVRHVPDGEDRGDGDAERCAALPEAKRGPDQQREDQVHDRGRVSRGEGGQPDDGRQEHGSLEPAPAAPALRQRLVPGQRERHDEQRAGGIAEPPRAPDGRDAVERRSPRRRAARSRRRSR